MRDALLEFGTITLAVKDTAVYSESNLDFGDIAAKFRNNFHNNAGTQDFIVFETPADFEATDGFVPFLQESANDSDYTTILTGKEVTAPVKGQKVKLPLPAKHARYLKAGVTPKSSTTLTGSTVEAYIEAGTETE